MSAVSKYYWDTKLKNHHFIYFYKKYSFNIYKYLLFVNILFTKDVYYLSLMRTKSDRLNIVNEIKIQCIELNLTQDLATKILFTMLDKYHEKGTTYSKELKLVQRHETPRKYLVNLHNDPKIKDTVLIRALEIGELQPTKNVEQLVQNEESSDDEEAPDLV